LVVNIGDDILRSTLVELNLRTTIKLNLKHYMQNGLSIYQTKYYKTTFLALYKHLSYIKFNCRVVGKTTLLRQKSQQIHDYYRIATKFAKAYQYQLL